MADNDLDDDTELKVRQEWIKQVTEDVEKIKEAPQKYKANQEFVLDLLINDVSLPVLKLASSEITDDVGFQKRARRALGEQHLQIAPLKARTAQEFLPLNHCGSLNAILEKEKIKLVNADWLINLAERNLADPTKSVLQPYIKLMREKGAFYSGPIWQGEIRREYAAYGNKLKCSTGVLIIVLSYLWERPDEPDPASIQLQEVARFLRFLKESIEYKEWNIVVFWDWASVVQGAPDRTPEQNRLLEDVYLFYTHANTLVLQNKRVPEGRQRDYEKSGWPVFEDGLSRMVKQRGKVVELQAMLKWIDSPDADAIYNPLSKMQIAAGVKFVHENESDVKKKESFNAMIEACMPMTARRLPLAPKRFNSKLRHAKFTRASDSEIVEKQYSDTFAKVFGEATQLIHFEGLGDSVSEKDWIEFTKHVIPRCRGGLRVLSLAENSTFKMDLAELVKILPLTLENLCLRKTSCFGNGTQVDWKKLDNLELLDIEKTKIIGSMELIVASIAKSREELEKPKSCEVKTTLKCNHVLASYSKFVGVRCCRLFWLCYLYPSGHTARVLEGTELVVNTGAAQFEASF